MERKGDFELGLSHHRLMTEAEQRVAYYSGALCEGSTTLKSYAVYILHRTSLTATVEALYFL